MKATDSTLAADVRSASLRVASSRSPLRLRSLAPSTLIVERIFACWSACAVVMASPPTPSTRTLSVTLALA